MAKAGAFSAGTVPTCCRVGLESLVLASAGSLELEVLLEFFSEFCAVWSFPDLCHEGIDFLARLSLMVYEAGYRMTLGDSQAGRMLAISYFLQYLQWGYRQETTGRREVLDFAQQTLTHAWT
ncbi:unnamed protein product [Durusdinium trenchii]|uniref:Uncharacterized protein n=1 Tax=Durusdinium trenchii TaxID=1381693 RepID=A0ABP0Q2A5_9DINO